MGHKDNGAILKFASLDRRDAAGAVQEIADYLFMNYQYCQAQRLSVFIDLMDPDDDIDFEPLNMIVKELSVCDTDQYYTEQKAKDQLDTVLHNCYKHLGLVEYTIDYSEKRPNISDDVLSSYDPAYWHGLKENLEKTKQVLLASEGCEIRYGFGKRFFHNNLVVKSGGKLWAVLNDDTVYTDVMEVDDNWQPGELEDVDAVRDKEWLLKADT